MVLMSTCPIHRPKHVRANGVIGGIENRPARKLQDGCPRQWGIVMSRLIDGLERTKDVEATEKHFEGGSSKVGNQTVSITCNICVGTHEEARAQVEGPSSIVLIGNNSTGRTILNYFVHSLSLAKLMMLCAALPSHFSCRWNVGPIDLTRGGAAP